MKKIPVLVTTLITLCYANAGSAGNSDEVPVTIDKEFRYAQGSQSSARFADNDLEAIGCGATVQDTEEGVLSFGFCQAVDATGDVALCTTFSPELIGAINAISNYGFIRFNWNEQDECVSIRNSTQSIYIPDFRSEKSKKSK